MKERLLGKDLKVSAVGLGCMGFSHAYGAPTERKEAIDRLRQAAEIGYTFLIRQRYMGRLRTLIKMRCWWGRHP